MAQKSITSFFSVQKKKVEDAPRDNSVDIEKDDAAAKCAVTSPKPSAALAEVASPPVAVSKRRASRRMVVSSDEEENVSPSEESSKSPETESPETRKSARQKVRKGDDALREIEEKRAAKKARLSVTKDAAETEQEPMEACEVPSTVPEASPGKPTKAPETSPVKSPQSSPVNSSEQLVEPEKSKSPEKSPEKRAVSKSPEKSKSPGKSKSPEKSPEKRVVSKSPEKSPEKRAVSKSPTKSPAKKSPEKSPSKPVNQSPAKETLAKNDTVTSDEDEEPAKPKGKANKAKKTPTSKTKPAAKKKSPAVAKKPVSQAISSFFAATAKPAGEGATGKSDGTDYNPAKSKYHPIEDASWQHSKPVPYLALARTLECIEETSARLRIAEILSNFFRSVIVLSPDNLLQCVYLCLNKIAPAFEGLELGLAERSLMKAVALSSGRSEKQVHEETEESGDLGIVAQNSCGRQTKLFRPAPLSVASVFNQLKDLAHMKGRDSMTRKVDKVVAMYNACKPIEARYLIRSLQGKLRIGLAEQTVLQALALACVTTPPGQSYPPDVLNSSHGVSSDSFKTKLDEKALILKTTYCECPVYDKIVPVLLEHGIDELPQRCQISPGIPLRPMLAHPTKGVAEVLTRFDGRRFICEWKYDGERAQIHISGRGASVRIFSRNQEDNTSKYPEVVSRLGEQLAEHVTDCILDCEAVAWDREAKRIMPFQVLSTRKKKDASEADIKVQVCLFVFDLLYVNGEALVRAPLQERRKKLKEVVKEVPGQLQIADSLDTDSVEEVQAYLEQSVKGNCEGLMVKTLEQEATYEIAKRSRNWLKLKKDYLEGVGDTLDLVVLGGYLGRGKRAGVYGGFLLGCYDPETEEYQSICKIGTGFSDEALQTHSDFFKQHVLSSGPRPYYRFDTSLTPDHWFDAVQVWEVKCADLSLSPVHKAAMGIVDPEKGISLRFPRFLRIREDKKVDEATSASQVADLYRNQDQVKNQADQKTNNEDDFY